MASDKTTFFDLSTISTIAKALGLDDQDPYKLHRVGFTRIPNSNGELNWYPMLKLPNGSEIIFRHAD